MVMTPNEICRNYREAKNKPEQIKILADMNCISVGDIKKILADGGEQVEEPPKTNRGKKPEKNKPAVMPDVILDILANELDALDMQIKLLQNQLDPLVDRYSEIATFIKTYGSEK